MLTEVPGTEHARDDCVETYLLWISRYFGRRDTGRTVRKSRPYPSMRLLLVLLCLLVAVTVAQPSFATSFVLEVRVLK